MRFLRSFLLTALALVAGTASVHAEDYGVRRYQPTLEIPVDHYVGSTGHTDDGRGVAVSSGALGALQARARSAGGRALASGAFVVGVLALQHVAGADADPSLLLATGAAGAVTLETIDEKVNEITASQKEHAERDKELRAEVEKGQRSHSEFKAEMDKRVGELVDSIEGVVQANKELKESVATAIQDLDRPGVGDGVRDAKAAKQAKDDVAAFMRADSIRDLDDDVRARLEDGPKGALSTDDLRKGGIVVPEVIRTNIIRRADEFTPLRQHAHVYTISEGDALVLPKQGKRLGARWSGERKAAKNTGGPELGGVRIPVNKLDAEPAATVEMLQDAAIDVVDYIEGEASIEFSIAEGDAFVVGDGVEKPLGFLSAETAAQIPTFLTGNATGIPDWKVLAKLQAALPSMYASDRAKWYFNRASLFTFLTFSDNDNAPIWNFKALAEGGLPQFLGHEYVTLDAMAPLDLETNTFTTGDVPVAFGDMYEAYAIVDKAGMIMRPNPYRDNAFVYYYIMKRVGGQTVQPNALRLLQVGAG